ncbi:MAG: hypothetical protein J6M62_09540 [Selenomonadaceae bacterium]|nr:hypothetical protein [Selenomonadaceae bacterium]
MRLLKKFANVFSFRCPLKSHHAIYADAPRPWGALNLRFSGYWLRF